MNEEFIAKNIKRLRQSKNISIEEMARLSGLTKGYISKIENSRKAPPITTLAKIAQALEADVTYLFKEEIESLEGKNELCIVRKNEQRTMFSRGTRHGYQYKALAYKKAGKNMEPYIIEPDFESNKAFSHEGEEYMYMLEGTQEFYYGDSRCILEEGDSIYFDSIVPHHGRSLGKRKARILVVVFSYKRHGFPI
jgi:transcriptional regulator with XRE-family HTH domain